MKVYEILYRPTKACKYDETRVIKARSATRAERALRELAGRELVILVIRQVTGREHAE